MKAPEAQNAETSHQHDQRDMMLSALWYTLEVEKVLSELRELGHIIQWSWREKWRKALPRVIKCNATITNNPCSTVVSKLHDKYFINMFKHCIKLSSKMWLQRYINQSHWHSLTHLQLQLCSIVNIGIAISNHSCKGWEFHLKSNSLQRSYGSIIYKNIKEQRRKMKQTASYRNRKFSAICVWRGTEVCVCVCVCARACMLYACVHVCERERERECVCVCEKICTIYT